MRLSASSSSAAFLLATDLSRGAAFAPSSLNAQRSAKTSLNVASAPPQVWSPSSWKDAIAKQMPVYDSQEELDNAIAKLDKVA
eukprot:CAMPEP_0172526852 /NCGR_PEP_ID=MMETSP1067-20121228/1687_1 /TAXON_ID=265564 ORGANISM="Thalassiosira punctigera, Strain Tpunct2005C2" /NCGR_SAMPLE_ID=MMETSP1067 /ASSEMBLY_ACC=CAM_ASM_000444 /LENGTH=82 /DNA_ID=CAMNT_0013310463 /DNA_START=32 /DNA_END=277 /DNA_ORIENTATION=+